MESKEYHGILKILKRYIQSRDRTSEEVRSFLISKGLSEDTINQFLNEACESGLINDKKLVENVYGIGIYSRKQGFLKIESDLLKRGISENMLHGYKEKIPQTVLMENCSGLIEKKLSGKKISSLEIRKCLQYLFSKGYEEEIILSAFKEKGISLELE